MNRAVKWWRGRASLYIFGGLLVTAVVASGAVLAFTGSSEPSTARAVAQRPVVGASASRSACGMPAGDQRVPLRPPAARWDRIGDQVAPAAPGIGPGIRAGHRRLCWAHSPTGAVFAALNFSALASTYHDDRALVRELTASGRARDAAVRAGAPPPDPSVQVDAIGFSVLDYSAAAAVVSVAYRGRAKPSAEMDAGTGAPSLAFITYPLRWEANDWKVVVGPGAEPWDMGRLDSIAGYVPWGA